MDRSPVSQFLITMMLCCLMIPSPFCPIFPASSPHTLCLSRVIDGPPAEALYGMITAWLPQFIDKKDQIKLCSIWHIGALLQLNLPFTVMSTPMNFEL